MNPTPRSTACAATEETNRSTARDVPTAPPPSGRFPVLTLLFATYCADRARTPLPFITGWSPAQTAFRTRVLCPGVTRATPVHDNVDRLRVHARIVREALHLPSEVPLPNLEWHFFSLAFDTLGVASDRTMEVLETMAHRIANHICSSYGTAKLRLLQRISFTIWSNVASATIARMPYHGAALSSPARV